MEDVFIKDLNDRLKFLKEMKMDCTPKLNKAYTDEMLLGRIAELESVLAYMKSKIKK